MPLFGIPGRQVAARFVAQMTDQLTLMGKTEVDLEGGAMRVEDTVGPTVSGQVRPLRGREYFAAQQVVGETPYEITVPYPLPDAPDGTAFVLTSDSSLIWHSPRGDEVLHLRSPPAPFRHGRYLQFTATAKEG